MDHPKLIHVKGMPYNARNRTVLRANFEQNVADDIGRPLVDSPDDHIRRVVCFIVGGRGDNVAVLKKLHIGDLHVFMGPQQRTHRRVSMQHANEPILDRVHDKVRVHG